MLLWLFQFALPLLKLTFHAQSPGDSLSRALSTGLTIRMGRTASSRIGPLRGVAGTQYLGTPIRQGSLLVLALLVLFLPAPTLPAEV